MLDASMWLGIWYLLQLVFRSEERASNDELRGQVRNFCHDYGLISDTLRLDDVQTG